MKALYLDDSKSMRRFKEASQLRMLIVEAQV
jgi:hypothetical protein